MENPSFDNDSSDEDVGFYDESYVIPSTEDDITLGDMSDDDDTIEHNDNSRWNFVNGLSVTIMEDPVDKFLFRTALEERNHVASTITKLCGRGTNNQIVSLFVSPLIPVLMEAINSRATTLEEHVDKDCIEVFIRTLCILSFYRVTHTTTMHDIYEGIGLLEPTFLGDETQETLMKQTQAILKKRCHELGLPTSGNKPELVQRILGHVDTPEMEERRFRSAVMGMWFLKPLKQSHSMRIGRKVEDKIAQGLPAFLAEHSQLRLTDIAEIGLVRNQKVECMATSVDRVGCLVDLDVDSGTPQVVCVEIKAATNSKTEDEAKAHTSTYPTPVIQVQFGDADFKRLVWSTTYHAQVVHHAAVMNTEKVVFAVGSSEKVLYIVIVKFNPTTLENDRNFLSEMFHTKMSWWRNVDSNTADELSEGDFGVGIGVPDSINVHADAVSIGNVEVGQEDIGITGGVVAGREEEMFRETTGVSVNDS